jgi:hypothetical protein
MMVSVNAGQVRSVISGLALMVVVVYCVDVPGLVLWISRVADKFIAAAKITAGAS